MRWPALLLLALAGTAAQAQGGPDLLKTPECLAARKQLDALLDAGGPRDKLDAARQQAALKCFGARPAAPPDGRFVPPPVATEPIRLRPAPALPAAPAPPSVAVPRPPAVTSCDPAGCWDSNGTRYNQQGPVLLGPRGVCTVQAGVLNCP
jgi:hypothetical protein